MKQHDILIIGAGVSGIGVACHLRRKCSGKRIAIIERRQAIGGTWDLFRYPGIRSDSDMTTFGYSFRPWTDTNILADGEAIRRYVEDTAREYGVDKVIQFGRKVTQAQWSSGMGRWAIETLNEATGEVETQYARFVINCAGYYNHDQGYRPEFPDEKKFAGPIIHPQQWPEDLDYKGKKVVVIGSGATAITLVPSMAKEAAHVTMLQRSPSYVMSIPALDPISSRLKGFLPDKLIYKMARTRNIGLQRLLYRVSRERPAVVRRLLRMATRKQLGERFDLKHFSPSYQPWDERMCVVPNGDLFRVLRSGEASIVTDQIRRFTKTGIELQGGEHLDADIVISATGLNVQLLGGAELAVDGQPVEVGKSMTYKGVLMEGVPNAAVIFGYTNASWTLKVDIASEYICRLLNHMDRKGYRQVTPVDRGDNRTEDSVMGGLQSGYLLRAAEHLPKQGRSGPWRVSNDYLSDIPMLRYGPITDERLVFKKPTQMPLTPASEALAAA